MIKSEYIKIIYTPDLEMIIKKSLEILYINYFKIMKEKNEIRTELNIQQMASYKENRNSRNKMYHYCNKCTQWIG